MRFTPVILLLAFACGRSAAYAPDGGAGCPSPEYNVWLGAIFSVAPAADPNACSFRTLGEAIAAADAYLDHLSCSRGKCRAAVVVTDSDGRGGHVEPPIVLTDEAFPLTTTRRASGLLEITTAEDPRLGGQSRKGRYVIELRDAAPAMVLRNGDTLRGFTIRNGGRSGGDALTCVAGPDRIYAAGVVDVVIEGRDAEGRRLARGLVAEADCNPMFYLVTLSGLGETAVDIESTAHDTLNTLGFITIDDAPVGLRVRPGAYAGGNDVAIADTSDSAIINEGSIDLQPFIRRPARHGVVATESATSTRLSLGSIEGAGGDGILTASALSLERMVVKDGLGDGVVLEGSRTQAEFAFTEITGNLGAGLRLRGGTTSGVVTISGNGHGAIPISGVVVDGADAVLGGELTSNDSGRHGFELVSGEARLDRASATGNAGHGLVLGARARLSTVGHESIDASNNMGDGMRIEGPATATFSNGGFWANMGDGLRIEGTGAIVSIEGFGSADNAGDGLVNDGDADVRIHGAYIAHGRGGGLLVASGRVELSGNVSFQMTEGEGGSLEAAPGIPYSAAVLPGAQLVMAGTEAEGSFLTGNGGVAILVLGSLVASDLTIIGYRAGIVVATRDAPSPLHVVRIDRLQALGNGIAGTAAVLPAGVVVLQTGAAPVTAVGRFWLEDSSITRGHGPGIVIGGSPEACATLPCGSVDAAIRDVQVRDNQTGIVVQNGGDDGSATAVHLVGNDIAFNLSEGLLVRPSVFLPAVGGDARSTLTVAANRIHSNSAGDIVSFAEVVFDGAAFEGGPAPTAPIVWELGGPDHVCGESDNAIYACRSHKLLAARNRAVVIARRGSWPRDPTADLQVDDGCSIDVSEPCSTSIPSCP